SDVCSSDLTAAVRAPRGRPSKASTSAVSLMVPVSSPRLGRASADPGSSLRTSGLGRRRAYGCARKSEGATTVSDGTRPKPRVLAVDDEEHITELVVMGLGINGFDV